MHDKYISMLRSDWTPVFRATKPQSKQEQTEQTNKKNIGQKLKS